MKGKLLTFLLFGVVLTNFLMAGLLGTTWSSWPVLGVWLDMMTAGIKPWAVTWNKVLIY